MSLLSGVTLFTFSLSLLKRTNILEGISIGHFFFFFLLLAFYHLSWREALKAAAEALPSGSVHKVSFPVKLEPADQMLQADSIADSSG